MSNIVTSSSTAISSRDIHNGKFLLKVAIDSLNRSIETMQSPVYTVSSTSRNFLNADQTNAIENAFLARKIELRAHIEEVKRQFFDVFDINGLKRLQRKQQSTRDHYLRTEQVFDHYIDLLHTRSEENEMGMILKGCDKIASASLDQGLKKLDLEVPTIVCYLDRGEGASILKSGIMLWDKGTNPAAIIKVVRTAIPLPRLTSILHECGHQAAHMTNWNREISEVLCSAVREAGGSLSLADLWASWASEIAGDFWALHQSNFASVIGLSEVVTGSSNRVFKIIPGDPHPMPYLRVMTGLVFCKLFFGSGPWNDFQRIWEILYPINASRAESYSIAKESLPLLESICKAISTTKMQCFLGNSLNQILPVDIASPKRIRSFLNHDLSNFSMKSNLTDDPLVTITSFRMIQMFGGQTHEWIAENMKNWLIKLGNVGGPM
jgi:hypothetical protein